TFRFLGVPALLGRTIVPEDAKPGASPVFVMAHKLWRARYNLDPQILERTFVLNGVPTTLVGIMPPRFTKLAADLYRPVSLERGEHAARAGRRSPEGDGCPCLAWRQPLAPGSAAVDREPLARPCRRGGRVRLRVRRTRGARWIDPRRAHSTRSGHPAERAGSV